MKRKLLFSKLLLLCALIVGGVNCVWADETTYEFTSKSWGAKIGSTTSNWTSGKDGNQLTSGQGIQVTTGSSGANGTSPISFTSISKIVVKYCTNSSNGVGTIKVQVGSGTEKSFSVTKPSSGGTTLKNAEFNFSPNESGKVKITALCTTNSVYIHSVTITYNPVIAITAISMDETASVEVGETVTLTPTITPANTTETVVWESDDESVATVSNGTVTGVAAGSTTIRAKSPSDATIKAECTVTVNAATSVAAPTFSVATGTYNEVQSVALSCATDGATIYYTTDGTDPTTSSSVYSSAIAVNQTTTIKAFAIKDGLTDSNIASATYTLKCVAPSFDPAAGSVGYGTAIALETTTDDATIYYTTNGDTPTSSSSAYDSSNKPTISGNQTFKAIATKSGWSDSDVSSATYTYYYVITAVSNNDSYGTVSGTTTITATPEDSYRVIAGDGGYTVTSGSATVVNNGDNTFTVTPTSNCTVRINFEAIPSHTVTFSINGSTRNAEVQEDAVIPFPTAVTTTPADATEFDKVINGQTFVGWFTDEYTNASVAPSYVNTSTVTMPHNNVTYYAVYATVEESNGSYTLDYSNESALSSSTSWGSYGTAYNYTASDGSSWTVKAYKSSGMQINTGKDCSIKMPVCPGNIQSVSITCSAAKAVGVSSSDYSGSGTITYLASGTDATSQNIDLSSQSVTTGYIVPKSGSTAITKIVVNYRIFNASDYTTDNRAAAGIAFANAEVDAKLTSGYTGQALTNPNSLTVAYSSSDETVATVNSTGAITALLKTGTTTITASFAGNATYKPAEVSYDLTVTEKTPHGLAYATADVEKLTTDDAFTNTLTNPYSLAMAYSSSDTDVATVNASTGEVTIKGAGEATITATFAGNDDYEAGYASYKLTVSKATPTLTFASANAIGREGEDFAGNALTNPANLTVTYSSSDTEVATVNSSTGAVTIVADGTTTITASFAGDDTYLAASASYTLKVLDTPTITVSNQTIAYGNTFTVDDSSITGGAITVTSGNTKVATVEGLVITPIACGEVTITVRTAEDETYKAGEETFTLTITAPAGSATAPNSDVTYTFDFTDNSDWELPTSERSITTSYNNGDYDITLSGTHYFQSTNKYLMLKGTTGVLTFPAFDKTVTQIDVVGKTGASSSTKENIYVGSTAVSEETTGSTGTNRFAINSNYQDVGTVYSLKVTDKNAQITSIVVHQYQSPTATVTLNKYGYATYCSVNPIDFSSTTGYTAWRVSEIEDNGTVHFTKITEKIKGGQGVLLYNKNADGENTTDVTINFADGSREFTAAENLLVGTTAPSYVTSVVGDNTIFGLSGNSFKKMSGEGGTIPSNRAYLPVPTSVVKTMTSSGARLSFVFEEETTTSVNEDLRMKSEECFTAPVYDLQGRKVNNPKSGLYIVNGKKVIIK